jgi:hypothetical protein
MDNSAVSPYTDTEMQTKETKEMKDYTQAGIRVLAPRSGWLAGNRPPTHLLMDGGILHVPMDENEQFLKVLGEHLDTGIKNFVTERRTPTFVMHADLDILEPSNNPMTLERFTHYAPDIQSVIRDLFCPLDDRKWGIKDYRTGKGFDRLSMLVCFAPLKGDVEKDGQMWTKTGVHLVWPWIRVTSDQAMLIRSAWLQHFEKKFGLRGEHNGWEQVFDLSVYQGNGLRMVGSDKIEACPTCKGRAAKDKICPSGICNGHTGKYVANRIYRVVDAYDGKRGKRSPKLLTVATSSGVMEMRMTSIRTTFQPTHMNDLPQWFDPMFWHDEEVTHKRLFNPTPTDRKKKREALGKMSENVKSAKELGIIKTPKIGKKEKRFVVVQKWLRDANLPGKFRIPDVYRKVDIVDLVHKVGPDGSDYYLARTDSSFCMNKSGEHNHNNIYFLINSKGLYQKCFCRCPTTAGRKYGPCSKYRSSPYAMPPLVRKELFPKLHAKMMRGHEIASKNDLMDSTELPLDERIALQKAHRESINVRIERCRAAKKARYESRFQSKRG